MNDVKQEKEQSIYETWLELYHLAEDCFDRADGDIDFNKFFLAGTELFELKFKSSE